jgi:CheY-like chemotaxis protein/anti-sigma regulatory factor (Ser/Thr protein kinase)/HPt (histidine-containing phosphotransfer) domain-containing protein
MELVCRDFDFEALATRTVDMFQNSASKKGLLFDLTVSTCTSHIAHGDPMRLQQVIANLISNAVKFTENGHIALSLRARRGQKGRQVWRVSVTDTGVGIDPEELGRLFEPFVQIGNRRSGGTGLGLAISRRLIEAMHGRTGVESVPGRGSTFWFEVELPVGTLAGPAADRPSRRVDNSPPLHVLVAEDNPINQMLIAALVRRLGHRVTCVDNGRRALEAAEAVSYDCILMDMQMPEMDGVSATRAIRSRGGLNAHVPIIALTADAAPERRRFYDSAGLTGFITKPVQVDALRRELAAVPRREDGADAELGGELPLDPKRIADLTAALGPPKVRGLLELMLTELKERPETIRAACASGELARARVEAHNLKGSATNMGAAGVGRAAKALELALPGAEVELAAARLDAEVRRARQALEALLRGSAEPSSRSA